ncbi:unnamed protein product [Penicillium salamii]|uniref:Uncharacterized protein n=1 Tax=Penicillium salamii TaxID=1612424 RepID=A0A9W4NGV6_9EURO|nr:unnamed protein product [Penicillium salamii]
MHRLLANTDETLEWAGGLDLLDNLAVTVFEDLRFDGATAAQLEQVTGSGFSERYLCCIQVTRDVLDSVLAGDGFVRLVRGDWKEGDDEGEGVEYEALEGCTLENVGWMQVPFNGVMVVPWYYLRCYGWERESIVVRLRLLVSSFL